MPDEQQMQEWKEKIDGYKKTYSGMYGKQPSEKLIASFCKIYKIPWPLSDLSEVDMDFLD